MIDCMWSIWPLLRDRSRVVAVITNFRTDRRKLASATSFFAPVFHKWLEDRNADGRVNTGDDFSTSDRNLVSFGPVFPEFTRLDSRRRRSIISRVCFIAIRQRARIAKPVGLHAMALQRTSSCCCCCCCCCCCSTRETSVNRNEWLVPLQVAATSMERWMWWRLFSNHFTLLPDTAPVTPVVSLQPPCHAVRTLLITWAYAYVM